MKNFQSQLQKQNRAFNRRVRRFSLLAGLALMFLVVFTVMLRQRLGEGTHEDVRIALPDRPLRVSAVPEADPDDPSQLVSPIVIAQPIAATVEREGIRFSPLDQDILRYILQAVQEVPQDELRRRVDPTIVWEDFNDHLRLNSIMGRVCRFRGTLRRLEYNDSIRFPQLGIDGLYEGQIQDAMDRWYSFYIIEPPERPIERHDVAEINGVFFQLITYPSHGGGSMITPLIVGRRLEAQREHYAYEGAVQRLARQAPPWLFYPLLFGLPVIACLGLHRLMKSKSVRRRRRRP